jgi:hypothetical protein
MTTEKIKGLVREMYPNLSEEAVAQVARYIAPPKK